MVAPTDETHGTVAVISVIFLVVSPRDMEMATLAVDTALVAAFKAS